MPILSFSDSTWVTRDERWERRGEWAASLQRELPRLYREFNGIDFGHAHLGETLLHTQDEGDIEAARLEVLDFIFTSPTVPPDEEQVAPRFSRLAWELQKVFYWSHEFHRSLYDLFADDRVQDKDAAYRRLLANYLSKPEALTTHPLDHHGKLWSLPESKAFRDKFPKFNTQIWAYHWLQGAVYDVQLMGPAKRQSALMPFLIEHYHGYLVRPPIDWKMMPMITEVSPVFSKRFPEAAAIFDNLHMLHDNVDDILCRPDLYPTWRKKREAVLKILPIYLNREHTPEDRYMAYHGKAMADHGMTMGPRPPSAQTVVNQFQRPPSRTESESTGHH